MHIDDLQPFLRQTGYVTFDFPGSSIVLDLRNRHERCYAAKLLMNVRYPQSDIDSEIFRVLVHEGDRVLDAGANIGFTALELIEAGASKVLAVEPVPELFDRLKKLGLPSIEPIQSAISAKAGRTSITVSATHNQGSSIKPEMIALFPGVFGDIPATHEVEVCTIDDLSDAHGATDIWKLDIEGAEIDALEGARATLLQSPPRAIVVELYDQFLSEFAARISPTHPFGYRAFLRRDDYRLVFMPVDHPPGEQFENTSPMYVFTRQRLDAAD